MNNSPAPVLGFAAFSGAGKTTLLSRIIPLLSAKNIRVGLIKHSHHSFDIDKPGKDSYRLRKAGASPVLLVSRYRRAIMTEFRSGQEPKLIDQLNCLDQSELDLILVEGFKAESFPKIEIFRPAINKPLLCMDDPDIIAVATDSPLSVPEHITLLDLNNPENICRFILHQFPGLNRD